MIDRINKKIIPIVISALVVFISNACNEHLPSRNSPVNVLEGYIEVENISLYSDDGYLINPEMRFILHARNTYDETFNGFGEFKGSIEIEWERNQAIKKTILFDRTLLTENRPYKYDGATNTLTMDPGDDVSFFYRWKFDSDVRTRIDSLFELKTDGSCYKIVRVKRGKRFANIFWNPRKFSREIFYVSGYIKPFKDLAAVVIPRQPMIIEYETFFKGKCQSLPNPR